jgi:hypothetical protein
MLLHQMRSRIDATCSDSLSIRFQPRLKLTDNATDSQLVIDGGQYISIANFARTLDGLDANDTDRYYVS